MTAGAVLGGWAAALGIGGDRCVDREVRTWIDRAPIAEAVREDLRQWLIDRQLEQLEQNTDLSANPEAVAVAAEFWTPLVAPVVTEQWSALREPGIAFLVPRLSCRRAWRLSREHTTLDNATSEAFAGFWAEALREPARAGVLREELGRLLDAHGAEFGLRVREVLPGPPNAAESW